MTATPTPIPADMTNCPRCGTAREFMTPGHLDRCGAGWTEGNWMEPPGRWKARDYLGKPPIEQERMRSIELTDVEQQERGRS